MCGTSRSTSDSAGSRVARVVHLPEMDLVVHHTPHNDSLRRSPLWRPPARRWEQCPPAKTGARHRVIPISRIATRWRLNLLHGPDVILMPSQTVSASFTWSDRRLFYACVLDTTPRVLRYSSSCTLESDAGSASSVRACQAGRSITAERSFLLGKLKAPYSRVPSMTGWQAVCRTSVA